MGEVDFQGWPAWALTQGELSLQVVPSVGGRLMGIACGAHELCFTHPDLRGRHASDDPQRWAELCGTWSFPLWGGGKTWIAPESAWPGGAPHRDLDSGAWSVTDRWFDAESMGLVVQSPVCRQSGLQLRRRLAVPRGDTAWSIEHAVTNRGTAPLHCGLWDVLMLRRPASVTVPLPGKGTDRRDAVHALPGLPTRAELESSGRLRARPGAVELDCSRPGAWKCGFDSEAGEISAELPTVDGAVRYRRRSPVPAGERHAHGRPLEVFNAPELPYFEIETHSPAATLQPGETMSYRIDEAIEQWPAQPA